MTKDLSALRGDSIKFKVGYNNEEALADTDANAFHITSDDTIVLNGEIISSDKEYMNAYGVQWDVTVADPSCTRIGRDYLHKTLPVQSKMRGCLLDDDGAVVEYLPNDDWTNSTRDGSKGQVMVELPEHWRKFETDGNIRRVWISAVALPGYKHIRKTYVGAYQAALDRTNNKLASVVNTTAQYRGFANNAALDDDWKCQLGKPATGRTRTEYRTFARNRNASIDSWNCYLYECHKTIFWFFVVEYATRNSQLAYTAELTTEGFHKGGLGSGVIGIPYPQLYGYFGNCGPTIFLGYTDELGNGTGYKNYTHPFQMNSVPSSYEYVYNSNKTYPEGQYLIYISTSKMYRAKQETTNHYPTETDYWEEVELYQGEYDATKTYTKEQCVSVGDDLYRAVQESTGQSVTDTTYFTKLTRTVSQVNRYRGIEMPFAHLFMWSDGANVIVSADSSNGGNGQSKVYVCYDPSKFSDSADSTISDYTYIGDLPRKDVWIKDVIFGDDGDVIAKTSDTYNGGSERYFCDISYTHIPSSGEYLRGLLVGGRASDGSGCGLACVNSLYAPATSASWFGSRLCFIPKE